MKHLYVIFPLFLSMIISAYCIPRIIMIAHRKRLFDNLEYRKVHNVITPRLGGVSFFISIILSVAIAVILLPSLEDSAQLGIPFLAGLCSLTILCFVGLADDLISLKYNTKFFAQFLAAFLTVGSGLFANNFYGLFLMNQISIWLAVPFSIIFIVYIINAINLIDGIDGLAAGLSGIGFTVLGTIFWQQSQMVYAFVSFSGLGMLIPYLYYNVFAKEKYKIFMGDSGSLIIGYLLAFLIVRLNTVAFLSQNMETTNYHFITGISFVLIPFFDVVRVILCRLKHREHIFQPDNNHIHHKFLAAGFSSKKTLACILTATLILIITNALFIRIADINIVLIIDILFYLVLNLGLSIKIKKIAKYESSEI